MQIKACIRGQLWKHLIKQHFFCLLIFALISTFLICLGWNFTNWRTMVRVNSRYKAATFPKCLEKIHFSSQSENNNCNTKFNGLSLSLDSGSRFLSKISKKSFSGSEMLYGLPSNKLRTKKINVQKKNVNLWSYPLLAKFKNKKIKSKNT